MDEGLNVTYITLGGHVEVHKYRFLYFMIMFIVYILVICSNSTIVYLIVIHRNLHEPMYIFIAALLINSVLFSTALYPKFLIDFLSEKQIISYSACLFQYFLFYTLGGAEFLLLSAMAYDRYVSICKPLQYPTIMRKTTVWIFLALAWFVPACQLMATTILSFNEKLCRFTLKAIFCSNSIYHLHCSTSRALTVLGLVILLNVSFFPMLFILSTYAQIFRITYRSCRKVRKKAAETCLPHLLVLINFSLLCAFNVIIARLESDITKLANLIMTLQLVLYHPLVNPIIYGLKMKEISKHLKLLLCHRKMN
ncbi:olfactory receptor 6N2-like [Epinephelus fuscoguttatus]|uniref:olfactory receptor 6N2-like n=1 Tax=Epinephelus fuscoguttatus TaxID=293821 RepID=UPI0020D0AB5D|nr:olfactory receptor 6N2-like [Epinephelus fuscoguttatus]